MHQQEFNDLTKDGPEKKLLAELFTSEEERLDRLLDRYGGHHKLRIFHPKKNDYLKLLRK